MDKNNFANLCSNSASFTPDVFKGVGEILGSLNDVAKTFDEGSESEPINMKELDNTLNLLKGGAVRIFRNFFKNSK